MANYCHWTGKEMMASAHAANKAVSRLHKQGHPYKCPRCGAFHITKQGKHELKLNKARKYEAYNDRRIPKIDDEGSGHGE